MAIQAKFEFPSWRTIIIFVLVVLVIGMVGYWYIHNYQHDLKQNYQKELVAIADLKVEQLVAWRKERLSDARVVRSDYGLAAEFWQWQANPMSSDLKARLVDWAVSMRDNHKYRKVIFLDMQGKSLLSDNGNSASIDENDRVLVQQAMRERQIIFADFHTSDLASFVHLGLVVPLIIVEDLSVPPVGAVFLEIDPNDYLYPLLRDWPMPSASGETVLVERENNQVVFLNQPRASSTPALGLRLPITNAQLPAAMAVTEYEEIVEGIDYRGVPVWAVTRAVPDSSWFLIAKIDTAEVAAPMNESVRNYVILVGMVILATTALLIAWGRHQRAAFYRAQYQSEHERIGLLEKMQELTSANESRQRALLTLSQEAPRLSEQELLEFGLEEMLRLTSSRMGVLLCADENLQTYHLVTQTKYASAPTGVDEKTFGSPSAMYDGNHTLNEAGMWAESARTGKPKVENDYTGDVAHKQGPSNHLPIIRFASVPVMEQDLVRMILVVGNKSTDYENSDVRMMSLVAEDIWSIMSRKRAEQALNASEERYRAVVETTPDAITVTDADGAITFTNQRTAEMHGYGSKQDLVGVSVFDLVASVSHELLVAGLELIKEKYLVRDMGLVLRRKDGTEFPGELTISLIPGVEGKPSAVIGISRDITQRKRAEEQMRASEELVRSMIDSSLDMIIATDRDRVIIEFNRAAEKTFGYTRDEMLGQNVSVLYDNQEESRSVNQLTITQGRAVRQVMNRRKNGETFPCLVSASLLRDAHGNVIGYMGISRDVTEPLKAEKALRDSEHRFSTVFRSSPISVAITRLKDGILIDVNTAWEQVAGIPRDQAVGHSTIDSQSWKDPEQRSRIIRVLKEHGHVRNLEFQLLHSSGEVKDMLMSAELIDVDGEPCMLSMATDITERKQDEEKIRHQLEELQRWYDLTLDREMRSLELKREVNELLKRLNEPPRYASAE